MPSERRRLSDPRELRALSHPTRLSLLELLDTEGPMTATQAGERIGESPASASFHLRTLAKYGFVEEAPGGRGRQRPWRVTAETQEIREEDLGPEARLAADAFVQLLRQRDTERLHAWVRTRELYPKRWRDAAKEMRLSIHLTADELDGLRAAIEAALAPYVEREVTGERPADALPISIGLHAVPMRPPAADPTSEEQS
ncbi:MAG TPA: helix-turn-helix domain-containing protein [Mycobacteriales bacterium]|jgi:predicted ArsR family transcriptional regulator|nr:helix-turn-helix domain-containing protein [Mycobacteriales bacterium]